MRIFLLLLLLFFLSITTKYIQALIAKLLKIKLIKQDNTGQFFLTNKKNKKIKKKLKKTIKKKTR